uniref:CSON014585 protein n=1 Tax=Culicoides sonorensis TaxID=179676 RepID=A0A336MNC7_CULSO
MKRRIFKIFFIIYTISLNYHHVTGSGYLLFTKSQLKSNETRYFLLDAQLDEENSQEQQLRFDAQNDTKFLLFTSRNSVNPQFIELGDRESLLESNFNPGDPVRFIIHGFRDGPNAIVNSRGKRAYLEKGDFNVIVVDWSKGADTLNYLTAKKRIYSIGPIVSECGSDLDGACSHQRSAMYWAESINSETGFWSVPCLSYDDIKNKTCPITGSQLKMGGEPSNKGKASGVYYLTTASASPFALGPF